LFTAPSIAPMGPVGKKLLAQPRPRHHLVTVFTMLNSSNPVMRKAFTLIELLIVIAIIGILMSLLFPAASSAIDAARKAQAKNDVTQIAAAVVAYEAEYGKLPGTGTSDQTTDVNSALVNTLVGQSGNTNNPRQIVFLEIQAAKKGKSGTNGSGNFVDPWGGSYKIVMDLGYDNSVTAGTNSQTLQKKVAVWNNPSTHTNRTAAQKTRSYVTSWE